MCVSVTVDCVCVTLGVLHCGWDNCRCVCVCVCLCVVEGGTQCCGVWLRCLCVVCVSGSSVYFFCVLVLCCCVFCVVLLVFGG